MKIDAWLAHFGSVRSALLSFGLLAAVVLLGPGRWWLGVAVALMSACLAAAVVTHPLLRRRLPLLLSHLALLAVVVLAAAGRWCLLDGRFELTQGLPFDGRLLDGQGSDAHRQRLGRLSLTHAGFSIEYAAGRQRGPTRNVVQWTSGERGGRAAVIGDHRPLVVDGYRIYTSPNKGFAPLLRWEPARGEAQRGALHLPSFPLHELKQSNEWQLPDGRMLWVMLRIDETLIDPTAAASFSLPKAPRLVVRLGGQRVELSPGQGADLAGGRLVFEELRTWMGYRVSFDPTLPWLLAAALMAAACLAWHYAATFWPAHGRRWRHSTAVTSHG